MLYRGSMDSAMTTKVLVWQCPLRLCQLVQAPV